jgi:hypothetical protein
VIIWRAYYDPSWPKYIATPGCVIGRRNEGLLIKTGDSTLLVTEVQVAGGVCGPPHWPIGARLAFDPTAALASLMSRLKVLEERYAGEEQPA